MSVYRWALFIFGFLCTHQDVGATTQCNLINFATQGLGTCGLTWWQSNSFERETADLNPQVTDIIEKGLALFRLSLANISAELDRTLMPNSSDPLRKLIEAVALAEPYVLYIVMDAAEGFGMTQADMKKLGLPESLANEENKKNLYESYFRKSCSADIFRSFITCVDNWAADNCQTEDKISVVTDVFTNLADYYCKNRKPKPAFMSMLDKDFGDVYADVMKSFGIIKDPSSPFVFNVSPTSIFLNQTAALQFGLIYQSTCGYLLESIIGSGSLAGGDPFAQGGGAGGAGPVLGDFSIMLTPTSETGAGAALERLLGLQHQLTNCALRTLNEFIPEFFADNKLMFNHLKLLNERYYGQVPLSLAEPERGDVRYTVKVFGDPHMNVYKTPGTVTCPALGSQSYLSNEYFKLVGMAEKACDSAACNTATYVTSVTLTFPSQGVVYQTGKSGELPSASLISAKNPTQPGQPLTEKDGIKLEVIGSSVRITDLKSAAVFMFSKYRETYQIVVRMGEDVFDNSVGLLVLGCSDATDISATPALRRRRDTSCETACTSAPAELRDTCEFDCRLTGDLEVANITKTVVVMETVAEEKDAEIYKLYPTTAVTVAIATTTEGGSGAGVMSPLNLFAVVLLAALSWFI